MGLLVLNYTTKEGFLVSQLYLQIHSIKMLKTLKGSTYAMGYTVLAYKSVEDKDAGVSPIPLPNKLAYVEEVLEANDFYDQTVFGFAYDAVKRAWQNVGYTVEDFYPTPPTPKTYIYDCSGYSFRGFNCAGYDRDGYGRDGFNKEGYDRDGFGREGFNIEGYDRQGYDKEGYDKEGFGREGFNKDGYDRQGYDCEGYDRNGFNIDGYNREGIKKEE